MNLPSRMRTRFRLADRGHNVWQCDQCLFLAAFEADGPVENGWNVCPHCSRLVDGQEEPDEEVEG